MISDVAGARGILDPAALHTQFKLSRHQPSPDLAYFVQHYWIASWDLRGCEPYLAEVLAHPCVNLVFERGKTAVFGLVKGKFANLLVDQGRVLGVKFRPGGFYPFVKTPVSAFTDSSRTLHQVFGVDSTALEQAILGQEDEPSMVALVETFLRERLPERDEQVELVNRIVDFMVAEHMAARVDDVAAQFHLSARTLQRLFRQYVGVNPKWVIQRYRLQVAAEQLVRVEEPCAAGLAADLGYFDQAHFIKDFKTVVGQTPSEYARRGGFLNRPAG